MTTEEELLQEHYMGDRQSRQLYFGYSGVHEQDRQEAGRRRKLKKALSVRSLAFTSSGCIHPFSSRISVGVSGMGSDD